MRSSFCQAYAFPNIRVLLFTERLLEVFPDEEIAAVCAHELAHLGESRLTRYSRSIGMLTYLPWIFFSPLIHTFGASSVLGLLIFTRVFSNVYSKISRKLERRADALAKTNENDEGIYARALARLAEDNLMPVVTAKKRTHPDLYDRLITAGVLPDFPRPQPASSMAPHGYFFAMIGGLLLVIFATRLIGSFYEDN
ncbi:MAG: M48 family metalloprotease [Limisphaerales bacterium]